MGTIFFHDIWIKATYIMMASEEFKKVLLKLITCDYKEVSTETSACYLLLWMKKVKEKRGAKVAWQLLICGFFVYQTFMVDNVMCNIGLKFAKLEASTLSELLLEVLEACSVRGQCKIHILLIGYLYILLVLF